MATHLSSILMEATTRAPLGDISNQGARPVPLKHEAQRHEDTNASDVDRSSSPHKGEKSAKNRSPEESSPRRSEDPMNEVIPGLFLGDLAAAIDGPELARRGITHVVDCGSAVVPTDPKFKGLARFIVRQGEPGCDWAEACPSVVAKLIVVIDDKEDSPIADHFDAINAFVAAATTTATPAPTSAETVTATAGACLVHCVRGKSRSATAVAQYLMRPEGGGLTLRAAMRTVHTARPSISLNVGFKQVLMDLEKALRPGEAPSLVFKALTSKKPTLAPRPAAAPAQAEAGAATVVDAVGSNDEAAVAENAEPQIFTMCDSVAVLKAEAARRGISDKGTKRQLLMRVTTHQQAAAAAADVAGVGSPGTGVEASSGAAVAPPNEASGPAAAPLDVAPSAATPPAPVPAGDRPAPPPPTAPSSAAVSAAPLTRPPSPGATPQAATVTPQRASVDAEAVAARLTVVIAALEAAAAAAAADREALARLPLLDSAAAEALLSQAPNVASTAMAALAASGAAVRVRLAARDESLRTWAADLAHTMVLADLARRTTPPRGAELL